MQFARRYWFAAVAALGMLAATSTAQAQQYKVLPNDTEAILTLNIGQILKSEVAKSNKAILEIAKSKANEGLENAGVAKWLKKADFDLFRDLHSMTVAMPGGRPPEDAAFILLEGNFDPDKIESAANEASSEA